MTDDLAIILNILSAFGAITAAIVSAVNNYHIHTIHIEINHRMDELLKTSEKAAHAAGRKERDDEEDASKDGN